MPIANCEDAEFEKCSDTAIKMNVEYLGENLMRIIFCYTHSLLPEKTPDFLKDILLAPVWMRKKVRRVA